MANGEYPKDLKYTKDHEWAKQEGGEVLVGISAFAVDQLGDITMVELPREGEKVDRGKPIGVVESVKAVSDIYAPVSGKVVRINNPVNDSPETLQEDCYDEGWLVVVEASSMKELEALMDVARELMGTEDAAEGLRSFVERRPAVFQSR